MEIKKIAAVAGCLVLGVAAGAGVVGLNTYSQATVDQMVADAKAGVDITTDNGMAAAAAVAKVDITADNAEAIAKALEGKVDITELETAKATNEELIAALNAAIAEATTEGEVEDVTEDNLDLVLEYIYDNDGNLEELDVKDLDDDELDFIVDRVIFTNEIKVLAVESLNKELFDEIDGEEILLNDNSTYKFNDNDLESLRIDDDLDEIEIDNIDFDDKDGDLILTFKFKDEDNIKFEGSAIVKIIEGEFDDLEKIDIKERD